jgi:hypothetical protein
LEEQPLLPGPAVHSPLLGTDLRVVGRWLRLMDPRTGKPVPVPEEAYTALQAAEAQAEREQAARLEAEERIAQVEAQAMQAQRELELARAELARLRAQRGDPQGA